MFKYLDIDRMSGSVCYMNKRGVMMFNYKKLFIILMVVLLATMGVNAEDTKIFLDGNKIEFNESSGFPFVDQNNRTLVPLRVVLETFGASVSWDSNKRMVIAEKEDISVGIKVGSQFITVNGASIQTDTSAVIKNGRTFLPIRAVMEAFKCDVNWNAYNRSIDIVTNDYKTDSNQVSGLKTPNLNEIESWGYQIQGLSEDGAIEKLVESDYDMLVLEPTRTDKDESEFDTKGMVDKLKVTSGSNDANRKLVIAYIDIGQAEDWRWYWDWTVGWEDEKPSDWPDFIVTKDADGWEGNYTVKFWDEAWKNITIYGVDSSREDYNSIIDEVIDDGFDGIYLDWVEAFEDADVLEVAEEEGIDAQEEMIKFIGEMRTYARKRNPNFVIIQQNGSYLCDEKDHAFDVVDGIAQEGVWYTNLADKEWDDPLGYDQETEEEYTGEYLTQLKIYQDAGIKVFNVEYTVNYVDEVTQKSIDLGYVPYCSRSSLEKIIEE